MIRFVLIGVAIALLVWAILAKMIAGEPKKASKSQKADIMKQLLALSEDESKISSTAPPARLQSPSNQGTQPALERKRQGSPQEITTKISQPIRTQ